jgi:hypothetical protein
MHLSPGNSKVNTPPPLEIPRLIHPLPWKFQGSSTGGVRIIIGIALYTAVISCFQTATSCFQTATLTAI